MSLGTPLVDYATVPIPTNAVAGWDTGQQYHFTSRQSPTDLGDYYRQTLPSYGWKLEEFHILSEEDKAASHIALVISQANGPAIGTIEISGNAIDELTYVRIVVGITD